MTKLKKYSNFIQKQKKNIENWKIQEIKKILKIFNTRINNTKYWLILYYDNITIVL